MHAGERIQQRRLSLGLSPSQIERLSNSLAVRLQNPRCSIAHSTLAGIEAGSLPSAYKILSLAYCLQLTYDQVLDWYGIGMHVIRSILPDRTSLGALQQQKSADRSQHAIRFPFAWPDQPAPDKTDLFNASSLGASASRERFRYARIGAKDDSMLDIVPPGSIVRIDTEQRKITVFPWASLWHRPLYFVWHAFGHSCRWCQLNGNDLMLISHPASHEPTSIFRNPTEATIIGRVMSIWTSQHELSFDLPDELSAL